MVVLGLILKLLQRPGGVAAAKPHFITSKVEHKCILQSCARAAEWGGSVSILDVDEFGRVSPEAVAAALRPETVLVNLIYANNEIGSLNPISAIGKLCRARSVLFHTDAAQAFGKVDIHCEEMGIDFLSISGHKLYGPKGVGALYVRPGAEKHLEPLIVGGGQENGLRSGTLNVPGIVGLGLAAEIAAAEMFEEAQRLGQLRRWLLEQLTELAPCARLNGHPEDRPPGNLSLSFLGCFDHGRFEKALAGLAISSSLACSASTPTPSHVLKAIGRDDAAAFSTIRFGLGRFTTREQVEATVRIVSQAVRDQIRWKVGKILLVPGPFQPALRRGLFVLY